MNEGIVAGPYGWMHGEFANPLYGISVNAKYSHDLAPYLSLRPSKLVAGAARAKWRTFAA